MRPVELEIDPATGMKNYIANGKGDWATSAAYVKYSFERSIHHGRLYTNGHGMLRAKDDDLAEALRCLGQGLHTLEDFGAHTNYVELALREMGYHNVFAHTGTATEIQLRGKRVFPLVTGTFGMVDFYHSVLGEATDHFTQSEVNEMDDALGTAQQAAQSSHPLMTLVKLLSKVPGTRDLCLEAEQLQRAADIQARELSQSDQQQNWGEINDSRSWDDSRRSPTGVTNDWATTRAPQPDWSSPQATQPSQADFSQSSYPPQPGYTSQSGYASQPEYTAYPGQAHQQFQSAFPSAPAGYNMNSWVQPSADVSPSWMQSGQQDWNQAPQYNVPPHPQTFNMHQGPAATPPPWSGSSSQPQMPSQSPQPQWQQSQHQGTTMDQQSGWPNISSQQSPPQPLRPSAAVDIIPQTTPAQPLQDASSVDINPQQTPVQPLQQPQSSQVGLPGIPNFDPAKAIQQIYPILAFRDKVVRAISAVIEKIPGLEALVDRITETLTVFVLSLLAPFVRPIIKGLTLTLQAGSGTVIDSSAKHQYEPWTDPHCTDPTHSMLSKDHFGNLLNEPAGQVATEIVKFIAPRVLYAWEHPDVPVQRVMDDIESIFHHPAIRDEHNECHRKMFEAVRKWANDRPDGGHSLNDILSSEGVRNGKNVKASQDHTGHTHNQIPTPGKLNMGSGFSSFQHHHAQHHKPNIAGFDLSDLGNMLPNLPGAGQGHHQQHHHGQQTNMAGYLNLASKLPIPGVQNVASKINKFSHIVPGGIPGLNRGLDDQGESILREVGGAQEFADASSGLTTQDDIAGASTSPGGTTYYRQASEQGDGLARMPPPQGYELCGQGPNGKYLGDSYQASWTGGQNYNYNDGPLQGQETQTSLTGGQTYNYYATQPLELETQSAPAEGQSYDYYSNPPQQETLQSPLTEGESYEMYPGRPLQQDNQISSPKTLRRVSYKGQPREHDVQSRSAGGRRRDSYIDRSKDQDSQVPTTKGRRRESYTGRSGEQENVSKEASAPSPTTPRKGHSHKPSQTGQGHSRKHSRHQSKA